MISGRAEFGFTSAVPASRAAELLAWRSFEEVVLRIVSCCSIVSYEWEPFRTSLLAGCNRASFVLHVDTETYDAFFNSPVGIRAMYAVSPSAGEAADRLLVHQVAPQLLAFRVASGALHRWTAKSLALHEAKVWIVESEVEDQLSAEPSLVYSPWERESLSVSVVFQ
jgi:hypothetical protein